MKKTSLILLALLLIISLVACGTQNIAENHTTYNEPKNDLQSDIIEENYNYQNEQKDTINFVIDVNVFINAIVDRLFQGL